MKVFRDALNSEQSMAQSFLKAEWRKLAIANFIIKPEILSPFIPVGTELDLWEGKCYISLVGFMFLNTKLLGFKIPGHINFEEVNLRFYVKCGDKRGVVFIKEIVPKPALTWVANTIYDENYQTLPMSHEWKNVNGNLHVSYRWKMQEKWHEFKVSAKPKAEEVSKGSEAEFITEHYWGYAKVGAKRTNEYEVTHPRWSSYPVETCSIDVDFQSVYGDPFGFLNTLEPASVMLAEGSEITVEQKRSLRI